MSDSEVKVKDVGKGRSAFRKYRSMVYGDQSLSKVILGELLTLLFGGCPGALGLFLRSNLYRSMFGEIGRKVVFGRNITIRHAHKIRIGDNVIIDDNAVIDAKGSDNRGIVIGDNVYIGRNSIVYCKNGNITLGDRVNISSNCQVFSSNKLELGADTVVGAFTYLLSGGEYDYKDPTPFSQQSGQNTKGPMKVGPNCWLGAHVVITDGVEVGGHCVIAAGAVVTKAVPAESIAGGVPAKVLKSISE